MNISKPFGMQQRNHSKTHFRVFFPYFIRRIGQNLYLLLRIRQSLILLNLNS